MTKGEEAERLVIDRLRTALPNDYRVFGNVAWLERTADNRGLRDGEADVIVAHPDRGFLVVEVKAGEIARDAHGRWFAGSKPLNPNPFEQARTSMHALLRKLDDLPDRPTDFRPIAGHAVAFPDVDLASAGNKLRLLGPDVEADLLFDRAKLPSDDPARTREAVDTAFAMWAGDGGARRAPGTAGIALLEELLETPVALRSLLKSEI
ncbi:MAG TPA: nuclease-related domain-containing protein, partial [Candidatus Limnocylindrales bacterium]|nr:nuclease-related domain-containing protein [Candidatus Limnocylindrales bacterium]